MNNSLCKRIGTTALALLLAGSLAACSSQETNSVTSQDQGMGDSVTQQNQDNNDAGTTGIVISHEYEEIEVPVNPKKIISFDLGIVDILDSVGIEIGGLPSVNLPAYLAKFSGSEYVVAGGMKEADFEGINEYSPDIIFISGRMTDSYEELSKIAPTVYVATPGATYMETFEQNVEILARIFPDKAEELQAKADAIAESVGELKEAVQQSGLTALVMLANDGSISFYGAGSRYGVIHDAFGFALADDNIEASTHGQEATFEYIYEVNPDVIFVIDRSAAIGADGATGAAALLDNELVNATNAAQNGKIVYLSSDIWYLASGGLQATEAMVEEVGSALN